MISREIEATEAKARADDNKFAGFITVICSMCVCTVIFSGFDFERTTEFFIFLIIMFGLIHFFFLANIVFMSRVSVIFRTLAIAMIIFYVRILSGIT